MTEVALHWIGVFVAIHFVYFFLGTGRMANADAGLTSALLVALGAYTIGIHGNWRFIVVGAMVATGALAAALVEQYLWVLVGLGVLSVVLFVLGSRLRKRTGDPKR